MSDLILHAEPNGTSRPMMRAPGVILAVGDPGRRRPGLRVKSQDVYIPWRGGGDPVLWPGPLDSAFAGMNGDWFNGGTNLDSSRSSLRPRASWPDTGTDPQSGTSRTAGGAPRRHSARAE